MLTCIRQPRQGPTFGIKGGAALGGYSTIVPMENSISTSRGDMHAITAATTICSLPLLTPGCSMKRPRRTTRRFRPALPVTKDGSRRIAPVMLRRLRKLGIAKTDSDDLTPGRTQPFCAAGHPPGQHKWRRVLNINDRMPRQITIGQGPEEEGVTRVTCFDMAASEITAILTSPPAFATCASGWAAL